MTSVQFILQLKLSLYTIVHLLLEEFKISVKSSLSIQSLCYTVSPRVGVAESDFGPGVRIGVQVFYTAGVGLEVPQKNKDSASLPLKEIITQ